MINSKPFFNKLLVRGVFILLGPTLVFFILYPPAVLFEKSFFIGSSLKPGIFSDPETWKAFFYSFRVSLGVTVFTVFLGGSLAWLVVRTDFPYKKMVHTCSLLAFIIPPYILGLSWILSFGRNGYMERIFRSLFPAGEYTFPYYSLMAVVVVMTLHLYPIMYMSISNALAQVNPEMEKAALVFGASVFTTVRTITLPLILPSLLSTGLLVFSRTLANFTVPALLCLPVRKELLTTKIYSSLSNLDIQAASVLSLFLIAVSTLLFFSQILVLRKRPGTSGIVGEEKRVLFRIGERKALVVLLVFLFFGITTFLPLMAMLVSSFLQRWGLPLKREYITLHNYRELLLGNARTGDALRNSLVYGATAAALAALVGGGIVFFSHTLKTKAGKVLEALASWPMAFPNIVLAVAAILAWNRGPLRLYGTPWVIIVTYMVLFIPIILKQVSGLVENHDRSLILAARVAGASPVRSFFSVTLPAIAPGLKTGYLLCFLIALWEIPVSLMLYSSGQETLGVLLFGMQSQSYGLEMTSTLAVVIIVMIIGGNLLMRVGKKRNNHGKTSTERYFQTVRSDNGG